MKVKIFRDGNTKGDLESLVNKWLGSQTAGFRIAFVTQSFSPEGFHGPHTVISIFYYLDPQA